MTWARTSAASFWCRRGLDDGLASGLAGGQSLFHRLPEFDHRHGVLAARVVARDELGMGGDDLTWDRYKAARISAAIRSMVAFSMPK